MSEHQTGCVICGAELIYGEAARRLNCATCGVEAMTEVQCTAGHFVCDACHAGDAIDWIGNVCRESASTDPWSLADQLMRSPLVKMHGPEHHYLVPAVLLACAANKAGRQAEIPALLDKARQRAQHVLGGFCGTHGACGAGIGVGIAIAVWTGSTPLKEREWQLSNEATAAALGDIARLGGPRCCKRDTYVGIDWGASILRDELQVELSPPAAVVCQFHELNRECLRENCPFYPTVKVT